MTKTDIGIYRGLKEKFDPEVHIGFFITTDTGELLIGDLSLGQTIADWTMEDGLLTLKLNTGKDIRITFPEASETAKGLLSAADKALLNALADNLDSKVDKVTGKSLVADSEIEKLGGLPNSTELTNSIAIAKASGDNAQSDLNAHKQNTSNPHSVTKEQVGLGSVTNDAQVKRSEMGVANGVATLDEDGKVPATQLPSYVDDIVDVYATYTKSTTGVLSDVVLYSDAAKTTLVTGEAGKIYQNIADGEPNYQFRWTGTVFSQTGASSLIIGDIAGTAYDGAKGKANADNIDKIKSTSLTHINDTTPVTTTADKVSLNYECYEGTQYGSTGTAHAADIPAATTEKAGVMSAADKTKLEEVEEGAQVNTVTSVAGKTGAVTLAKADVGLGNVDNTSDADKPVSTAQASAIKVVQDSLDNHKADTNNPHSVTKTQVGLGNVDNTSDANKPISTAQQAALDTKADKTITVNGHPLSSNVVVSKADIGLSNVTDDAQVKRSEMGSADGVATLDSSGKVLVSQLPSYVSDVVEYNGVDNFPETGDSGKIYVDTVTNNTYRWSGTTYVEISKSIGLGETSSTAYPGDKGKAVSDSLTSHINDTDNPHNVTKAQVGLPEVDNTSDANKPVSTAQAEAIADAKKAGTDAQSAVEAEVTARENAIKDLDATITSTDGTNVQVKVTEVDGKITSVNIATDNTAKASDLTSEINRAETAEADAKKAGTDAQAALDTYKTSNDAAVKAVTDELADHKAEKDKKHIPEGGNERQILVWESDGTAKWDDLNSMFTGLEELLAYGVEWEDDVADPHLTRIGNMSLHKTLPIQSQLKGCIAQADEIIYWLDEEDWRFREDPKTLTVDLTEDTETFTVASVEGLGVNQWLRSGEYLAKITAIDTENLTLTVEWELPESEEEIDLTTISSLEIGSRLDGYDGTVRVYCPNFYIKSQIDGSTRRVWLSTVKIDNTWVYQHEILLDAYRSTVLNTAGATLVANGTIEAESYLASLPANSAISVVNTAAYCRGGSNSANYDKYLDTDPFRTQLGKPRTSLSRANMRTYSRNAGSEMINYNQYKNIFYWLWVVEYANFNCQEAYNEELTAEGYRQGGMGSGVTAWNSTHWSNYNEYYPLTPCGYTNELGNGTGVKPFTTVAGTNNLDADTTEIPAVTSVVPRWRGFENPFGDIWTNLDGIIIDADADNHPNNMNYVYTCLDASKFADSLNDGYEKVGEEIHTDGYTELFDLGDAAHIIPHVMGGSTTTYKCDCHWTGNKNATLRTLLVGGSAYYGATAGLGNFNSNYSVSGSNADVGFRSVSSFMSFLDN